MTQLSAVPEQIGRYEILSELGRGAMGHVYLALDPNIQRKVALKVFLPLLKVDAQEELELQQRFIFEARAAGKLKHPGIVLVFDADTDPKTGLSFIAMEWVDGPSLQDLVSDSGSMPIHKTVACVEQVAIALDTAHREGLVHRDVKPANILLDADGFAKISDFGIAKLASMSITGTGWIPGTPFYMSPEQVRNDAVDGRSDLYSLGVVLYQCLTGHVPFHGNSLASMTYMILEVDPRPPRWLNPYIPEPLESVIQRAMEKSPEKRFQSGQEFAEALSQCAPAERRPETLARWRPVERPEESGRQAGRAESAASRADQLSAPPKAARQARSNRPRYALAAALAVLLLLLIVPPTLRSWRSESPESRDSSSGVSGPLPPVTELPPAPEAEAESASLGPVPVAQTASLGYFEAVGTGFASTTSASLGPVRIADGAALALFGSPPGPNSAAPAAETRATAAVPPVTADPPAASRVESSPAAATSPGGRSQRSTASAVAPSAVREAAGPTPAASSPPLAPATRQPAAKPPPSPARETRRSAAAARSAPAKATPKPHLPAPAQLEVLFRNRLKNADISVWIDEKKVWQQNMTGPKNLFKKAFGKDVWTTLALRPGKRVIDVRITGSEGKIDLVKRTEAVFSSDEIKRLRVILIPRKTLKLEWKDRKGR